MSEGTIDASEFIEAQAHELARTLHRALVAETALAAARRELEAAKAGGAQA